MQRAARGEVGEGVVGEGVAVEVALAKGVAKGVTEAMANGP